MKRLDPMEILIRNIALGLVRAGMSVEAASIEAEEEATRIIKILSGCDLDKIYLHTILMRSQVYRLCTQHKMSKPDVAKRLSISLATAKRYYRSEMLRIRRQERDTA